jgi:two-component system invasion response regulator UvrY
VRLAHYRHGLAVAAVRVLAVDDQEVFLQVARDLIAAAVGFEQVGEASSGAEAVALAIDLRPDLVLIDVRMPGMDGVETMRRIRAELPDAVVVLTSLDQAADLPSALLDDATCMHVRKQDLSVRRLRELWESRG